MKQITLYGECPNCGSMCQPDGYPDDNGWIEETANCCDCQISFSYYYELEKSPETWEKKWKPEHIESFADDIVKPRECQDG